ncbi:MULTISPECIES: PstS family phosphate ABC transporter substrate-binding protein [Halorussus]|nr:MULTISPECIES: substrate-binding domain-containing protein [Halorussus]
MARQDGGNQGPLRVGGSSTVYPITSQAGSVWNSNPPASDEEYWGPSQWSIDTDVNYADFWASRYGFESGEGASLPFNVTVGLSHSGTGLEKLRNGVLDIGDASATVAQEFPDAGEEELGSFVDHVVGVDAQPLVVSREIYDAGVTELTLRQVQQIYRGEIANWSEIPSYEGEDREIQAVGRAEGSGTDTSFRANVLGGPNAPMEGTDVRRGQNQQVQTLVAQSDNAIAYIALAFVDEQRVPPVALTIEGTTYEYGRNLGAQDYPLNRDLHCYTWQDTSPKEAAFILTMLSDLGQERYVAANNYVKLPTDRQEEQVAKLPEPEQGSPQDYIGGSGQTTASDGQATTTAGAGGNETETDTQTTTSQ